MGRIDILININMFKLSVVVCSMLLGTILSQGQEDTSDALKVVLGCTADTPLGDKMAYALNLCYGERAEEVMPGKGGKGKKGWRGGKGKGKKHQCPTVDDILDSVEKEMEGSLCIMAVLGWIDENGEFNDQAMKEDINSLPNEVSADLTEEDVASLTEAGMMFTASKCFDHMFLQSCKNYMSEKKGEDRFGFLFKTIVKQTRGQCFATCNAVGFAASTTCSGESALIAGVWKTSDIPCNQLYPALAFLNGN